MELMLTIITPTYNRKNKIEKLYQSLLKQTCYEFQWIVVDDGSTDGTKEWFESLTSTSFLKEYHYKENGGKHTALNESHDFILGKYVCIVDSDDTLTVDAVDIIINYCNKYSENEKIGTFVYLKATEKGKILSPKFKKNEDIQDYVEYRDKMRIDGDCFEITEAQIFCKYKFPVFENEKFLPEGSLWYQVGREKKSVFINKVLYVGEYLEGGLTKQGHAMRIKNPIGQMYTARFHLRDKALSMQKRIKSAVLFVCYGYFAKMKYKEIVEKSGRSRLIICMWGLGYALYHYWKFRYNDQREKLFL